MAASDEDEAAAAMSTNEEAEEESKISLGGIGYAFKMGYFRLWATASPKVVPPSAPIASKSKKSSRRKKVYAALVPSDEGMMCLGNGCQEVLVPLDGKSISLAHCRRLLFSRWTTHAMSLLYAFQRQDAPLSVLELPTLKLKLVCCPDPRPNAWLQAESTTRITHALAEDDNQVASLLWIAECGWDLTQVKDIFGPILVFSANGEDFKLRRLRAFARSYFGNTENTLESIMTSHVSMPQAGFLMPEYVTKAARRQAKGKIPATDLLTHFDGSKAQMLGDLTCANCSSTDSEDCKLRACSCCEMVFYCGPTCQKSHWHAHKALCKKAGAAISVKESLS